MTNEPTSPELESESRIGDVVIIEGRSLNITGVLKKYHGEVGTERQVLVQCWIDESAFEQRQVLGEGRDKGVLYVG